MSHDVGVCGSSYSFLMVFTRATDVGTDGREIHWDFIRLALSSVADMAIFPLQDVLGPGTEHRMNRPGTAHGNWEWRFDPRLLTEKIEKKLLELTTISHRNRREPSCLW